MSDVQESINRNNARLRKELMLPVFKAFMTAQGDTPERIKNVLEGISKEDLYAEDIMSYTIMNIDNMIVRAERGNKLRSQGILPQTSAQ